jgi:hypothetical protein
MGGSVAVRGGKVAAVSCATARATGLRHIALKITGCRCALQRLWYDAYCGGMRLWLLGMFT